MTSPRPPASSSNIVVLSGTTTISAALRWARSKRSLVPPGLVSTFTPGRSISASEPKRPRIGAAGDRRLAGAQQRHREERRLLPLQCHRNATHRQVELVGREVGQQGAPGGRHQFHLGAERMAQAVGHIDIQPVEPPGRFVEQRERPVVAGQPHPHGAAGEDGVELRSLREDGMRNREQQHDEQKGPNPGPHGDAPWLRRCIQAGPPVCRNRRICER